MNLTITIGDRSGDGHEKKTYHQIESNLSMTDIKIAYQESVEKFGVNPIKEICCNYEDTVMSDDYIQIFKDAGYEFGATDDDSDPDEEFYFDENSWLYFILWFIEQSNPEFDYSVIYSKNDEWHIGGYGLF